MDLADKMAAVDVKPDNRISEKDLKFCKDNQAAYDSARIGLAELECFWEDITNIQRELIGGYDEYVFSYDKYIHLERISSEKIREEIRNIHGRFIRKTVRYFNKTYSVNLDDQALCDFLLLQKPKEDYSDREQYNQRVKTWEDALDNLEVSYQDILEQLFIQLNGRSFAEKAIDEIKEKCHKAVWSSYSGTPYYEIKGETVRFSDRFVSYTDWYSYDNWKINDCMKRVIAALAYYETEVIGKLSYPFNRFSDRFEDSEIELSGCEKVKRIKVFKNGRVDVRFSSKENAAEFTEQYLGLAC